MAVASELLASIVAITGVLAKVTVGATVAQGRGQWLLPGKGTLVGPGVWRGDNVAIDSPLWRDGRDGIGSRYLGRHKQRQLGAVELGPLPPATFDDIVDANLGTDMCLTTRACDRALSGIAVAITISVSVVLLALVGTRAGLHRRSASLTLDRLRRLAAGKLGSA